MEANNSNKQMHELTSDASAFDAQNNHQTNKEVKKSRGNRKLQRYRRKLRNQGMDSDTIANLISAWVDITQSKSTEALPEHNEKTTTAIINETIFHLPKEDKKKKKQTKKKNINKKQTIIKKKNKNSGEYVYIRKVKTPPIIQDSFDYTKITDEIFSQMFSKVADAKQNSICFLNEDEKIKFIRHYTSLIDRLSYIQLKEFQWKHYNQTGMTENIWKGGIQKHRAEKYSICHTYGRSKTFIQQRLNQIEQHLQKAHNAIQQFEEEFLSKFAQNNDCFFPMKQLYSIICQFVQEKQQSLQHDMEYKREMLVLDATDHQLLQKFLDVEPNKSQVRQYFVKYFTVLHAFININSFQIISAQRIWQATKNQMFIEEDIAQLEHRLTSTQSHSPSNLIHRMIDDIDTNLKHSNKAVSTSTNDCLSVNEIKRLELLKKDIIHRAILTSRKMAENSITIIPREQNKFSLKNRFIESTSEWQQMVLNTIEIRRKHMIKRSDFIIQHKLATPIQCNNNLHRQ